MVIPLADAKRLALEAVNRAWGYPTATDELVILGPWAESASAWVFTYNTRAFLEVGDIMQAIGIGNGPLIVVKATGAVHQMTSGYSAEEALRVFGAGHG